MTIIELLNKIANGEEIPKKIKVKCWDYEFKWNETKNNYYDDHTGLDLMSVLSMSKEKLNENTEILEEENEIKKIPYRNRENRNRQEVYYELVDDIFHKINDDILPVINKLKEDK